MSDSEVKSIAEVKKEKKLKKQLAPEALKNRQDNMKKALEAKKAKFDEKNKLKLVEYNISDLINNNDSSSDESEKILKLKKLKNRREETPEKENIKNNIITSGASASDYKLLMDSINNINKKVEKLYIMKKNKPVKQSTQPMPVYVNTKNEKSDDLLNAIRNKMLNN
jgi:hypothetical protein